MSAVTIESFTTNVRGARIVCIVGKDDKRDITGMLSEARSGKKFPDSVIYKGKTNACHAQRDLFLKDWEITHAQSH